MSLEKAADFRRKYKTNVKEGLRQAGVPTRGPNNPVAQNSRRGK